MGLASWSPGEHVGRAIRLEGHVVVSVTTGLNFC